MTLTEDELARLAELEDLLTVGLVEQPINGSVLSWGEAALIAHRIGRHLLRATPVADTAGIDAAQEFIESITAFVPVDAELVNATLAELQESPLPGARYAYEVVKRRFAAALRTPKPEGDR